jgi:hypothetical protein
MPDIVRLMAIAVLIAPALFAGQLAPVCMQDTLADYINNSTECSIGIQNFDGFTFSATGSGTPDTAADIELTPATGGFTFSQVSTGPMMSPISVALSETAQYLIGYDFQIDPAPVAGAADLGMDPPFGNVSIDQYYCADSLVAFDSDTGGAFCYFPETTFSNNGAVSTQATAGPPSPQDLHVDNTMPTASWNTGVVPLVPPAMNSAGVLTVINLDGTNQLLGSGFDSVTGDSFITPEPGTIALGLAGLLAIAISRRRSHARV